MEKIKNNYDVIIIGSGVGGLSCALDLAKAGFNVLIAEKHHVPGGYCSSFKKRDYYFDACAHYLGSCRPEGQVTKLLLDHDIKDRLELIECNPSDVIITNKYQINVYRENEAFLAELENNFPTEKSALKKFLEYLVNEPTMQLYIELKEKTFRHLLDHFFSNEYLKSIFAMLLGNVGLPSNRVSAITGVLLYREFVLDGGYYPRGGMQQFPNALVERIREYGGDVSFLAPVTAITLDQSSGSVEGCTVRQGRAEPVHVTSRCIVANCDPYQLFFSLLPERVRQFWFQNGLDKKVPSVSAFMLHIGVRKDLRRTAPHRANVWYYGRGDVDSYYERLAGGELERGNDGFVFCSVPSLHDVTLIEEGKHSLQAIVGTPVMTPDYWERNKESFAEDMLLRLEKIFPNLRSGIEVMNIATPFTLMKYTHNYQGAMYGWASTPEQVAANSSFSNCPIEGLFLTGHWAGLPVGYSGVPLVVSSGRNIARKVIRFLGSKRKGIALAPTAN